VGRAAGWRPEQAEALARAEAEQRVLQQRAENRQAELDADVKRVADAEKYRRQQVAEADAFERRSKAEADAAVAEQEAQAVKVRAQAEADAVRLAGEARAAAIKAEAEALKENQDALLAQRALEQLPALMAEFAKGYERVGSITVVGGAGSASDQIAGEPALALTSVLASVKAATGVDLAEVIQGRAVDQGIRQAVSQSVSQGGRRGRCPLGHREGGRRCWRRHPDDAFDPLARQRRHRAGPRRGGDQPGGLSHVAGAGVASCRPGSAACIVSPGKQAETITITTGGAHGDQRGTTGGPLGS